MRSEAETEAAESEFEDRVWHERHLLLKESGSTSEEADAAADAVGRELGHDKLGPYSDFEWGYLNGQLSAIRWVLGSDWGRLDT
jgi:hypothetical protein